VRRRCAPPARAEKERHQQVEVWIRVAGEGERRKIGGRDDDGKLLGKLADESMFGRLALLDLAAGEFPKPGERTPWRALGDEDPALAVEKNAGRNKKELMCRAGGHRLRTGAGTVRPDGLSRRGAYAAWRARRPRRPGDDELGL